MKLIISDKNKKDKFVALFHTLKNCTSIVSIVFDVDNMHIQGIDKSHVCMFDINLQMEWFNEYSVGKKTLICFDTHTFHSIISSNQDSNNILIHYDESCESDTINVDLTSNATVKGDFNKYFKIPLNDYDYTFMGIPKIDYDAEFSIKSKTICDIVSQMMTFGNDINIKCSEEKIDLVTNGMVGEMLVNIPIEDLSEYSVVEGDVIDLTYSLNYIHKMCLTNKLSSEINFYISNESPMKLEYDLENNSFMSFYIAPKITD